MESQSNVLNCDVSDLYGSAQPPAWATVKYPFNNYPWGGVMLTGSYNAIDILNNPTMREWDKFSLIKAFKIYAGGCKNPISNLEPAETAGPHNPVEEDVPVPSTSGAADIPEPEPNGNPDEEMPPASPSNRPQPSQQSTSERARTADAPGRAPKKSKTDGGTSSSTSLPGSGPGAEEEVDSATVNPVPRPVTSQEGNTITFRKTHRFLSFAYASKIIESGNTCFMTTSLLEIPWNRYFMYMDPSELANLPVGSSVTSLSVKVVYRGVHETFETNSSNSNTAAMNQPKDIGYALGLCQMTEGVNCKITGVEAAKQMIPNTLQVMGTSDYEPYIQKFYGVPNDNESFNSLVPSSYIAKQVPFNSYFCLQADKTHQEKPGWFKLSSMLNVADANLSCGRVIANLTYKPAIAFPKCQMKSISCPYPQSSVAGAREFNVRIPFGSARNMWGRKNYNWAEKTGEPKNFTVIPQVNEPFNQTPNLHDFIEQSQFVFNQDAPDFRGTSQPTFHVGILQCPKLTSAGVIQGQEDFTDLQGHFEVVCEAKVNFRYETHYPYADDLNTDPKNQMFFNKQNVNLHADYSMWSGLYRI